MYTVMGLVIVQRVFFFYSSWMISWNIFLVLCERCNLCILFSRANCVHSYNGQDSERSASDE